jgi:thioesterase domain-containing protein
LFCLPAAGVTSLSYNNLANYLGQDRPFYSFEYVGMDGESEPQKTVAEIAQYNIELLRSIQPEGPYYLAGMCFGAVVAYEMAHQLLDQNQEIAFLGILDSRNLPRQKENLFPRILRFMVDVNQKIFFGKLPIKLRGLDFRLDKEGLDDETIRNITRVYEAHAYAHLCYISPPLPVKISLFMTEWEHSDFLKEKWQMASTKILDVVPIPGVHQTLNQTKTEMATFMDEPHIQTVAQLIQQRLEIAEER